ncbi:MAG TPA: CBS domain-containing protein, partial [Acidimicrobiales bacterium]|nr:CBS domain-containing protein [Acidimicrobiales bacterium]
PGGTLTGLLEVDRLARLPAAEHPTTRVASLAHPVAALLVARPEDHVDRALERMMASDGLPTLVLNPEGRLIGVLTLQDVERAAERAHHAAAG